jgi:hypothetical protein
VEDLVDLSHAYRLEPGTEVGKHVVEQFFGGVGGVLVDYATRPEVFKTMSDLGERT